MAQCKGCPAFYEVTKENVRSTAGGWEKKKIDGKEVVCCRPAVNLGPKKAMDRFCYYCLATPMSKKIGNKASWTGSTPKWCPAGRGVR